MNGWESVFEGFREPDVPEPYLPHRDDWYRAFELCSFDETRVVILGQDPYHTPGVAHGLAFSVQPHVRPYPPSLRNIFTELYNDLGCRNPSTGSLVQWASEGVLLLNTTLTVRPSCPGSHQTLPWWPLIKGTLQKLSEEKENLVFLVWGNHAAEMVQISGVDNSKHLVLSTSHPSPFSAHRSFFGSRPFSTANRYLVEYGKEPISWCLP